MHRALAEALTSPSQKPSRAGAVGNSSLFPGYSTRPSRSPSLIVGNAKELFSYSSIPDDVEIGLTVDVDLSRDARLMSPTKSSLMAATTTASEDESTGTGTAGFLAGANRARVQRHPNGQQNSPLEEAIRQVRRRIANERQITVTYGVSDSDIRQLISQLRMRGCDANKTPEVMEK